MISKTFREILQRVEEWPQERQEDAARVLMAMEEQDESPYSLSNEQIAEVEQRIADPKPQSLTLEEVRQRFAQRRA